MTLETERLILRPWSDGDAAALYEYARDHRVGPAAGWPPHSSVQESRQIIQNVLRKPGSYAITLRETGKLVGAIGLKIGADTDLTNRFDECELGYWVGVPHWGEGFVPEAARALIQHAFADLGMKTIWCAYYEGNNQSKRVQEKLGFRFHHTSRNVPVPLLGEFRTGHVSRLECDFAN